MPRRVPGLFLWVALCWLVTVGRRIVWVLCRVNIGSRQLSCKLCQALKERAGFWASLLWGTAHGDCEMCEHHSWPASVTQMASAFVRATQCTSPSRGTPLCSVTSLEMYRFLPNSFHGLIAVAGLQSGRPGNCLQHGNRQNWKDLPSWLPSPAEDPALETRGQRVGTGRLTSWVAIQTCRFPAPASERAN